MVFMPHWPKPISYNKVNYNLDNMQKLLKVLGSPQLSLPPVIHIAGTNGKGSTNAYIKSICMAAKISCHSYTSPHLLDFNERIVINGEKIDDAYLFELCEIVRIASEKSNLEISFFEGTTAIAFLAFAQNKADLLVLETGLGGRLDATNVITKPLMSIITPISFDHMNVLGNRLQDIAYEKSGIIKSGAPCIVSNQLEIVSEVLLLKAREEKSPYIAYGMDFALHKMDKGFQFASNYLNCILPFPSLKGDHQILNAATTIAAMHLGQNIFHFKEEHFIQGIQNAVWPGRISKVNNCKKFLHPDINPNIQIWVDGAHNQHGAASLANWINDDLKGNISLIIGMTKNRDIGFFLREFEGIFNNIYTVPVQSEPLSYSSYALSEIAKTKGINTIACESLENAFSQIDKDIDHLVITGSLFLASDVFKLIGSHI